jgi:hypothetical protein
MKPVEEVTDDARRLAAHSQLENASEDVRHLVQGVCNQWEGDVANEWIFTNRALLSSRLKEFGDHEIEVLMKLFNDLYADVSERISVQIANNATDMQKEFGRNFLTMAIEKALWKALHEDEPHLWSVERLVCEVVENIEGRRLAVQKQFFQSFGFSDQETEDKVELKNYLQWLITYSRIAEQCINGYLRKKIRSAKNSSVSVHPAESHST